MGNLLQHTGIRTGDSRKAERTDGKARQKNIQIMDGNGDLAKLSSFVSGYEKYIETFAQYGFSYKNSCFGILPERNCHARARNPDSTSRVRSRLAISKLRNQASRNPISLQLIHIAVVGSAKYM